MASKNTKPNSERRQAAFEEALELAKIRNLNSITAKNNQETMEKISSLYGTFTQIDKP